MGPRMYGRARSRMQLGFCIPDAHVVSGRSADFPAFTGFGLVRVDFVFSISSPKRGFRKQGLPPLDRIAKPSGLTGPRTLARFQSCRVRPALGHLRARDHMDMWRFPGGRPRRHGGKTDTGLRARVSGIGRPSQIDGRSSPTFARNVFSDVVAIRPDPSPPRNAARLARTCLPGQAFATMPGSWPRFQTAKRPARSQADRPGSGPPRHAQLDPVRIGHAAVFTSNSK